MRFVSEQAERYLIDTTAAAAEVVVALDFDGTLAPIVAHPTDARIHPGVPAACEALARSCRAVALITGRPVRQLLVLADLDELGVRMQTLGLRLEVFGQYGAERWSSDHPEVRSAAPAPGLAVLAAELPELLGRAGVPDAWVEDKGLALAVHTRELSDPVVALARLEPTLREAAVRHGLDVEPGRLVLELRSPGPDKGVALAEFIAETSAAGAVFVGDDLGDLPAFAVVLNRRQQSGLGLRVLAGAAENHALADGCDLLVDGVAGVVEFLTEFAIRAHRP